MSCSSRRGFFLSLTLGSSLALVLAGCSTPIDPAYLRLVEHPTGDQAPSANTLGPGDKLAVRVYDEDKLGGEFVVAPGGTINFPLVGKLEVEGLTCAEIEDQVARRLTEGYLNAPSVSCSVLEFESKKVAVFGEVNSPGNFRYVDRMTVVQAVADAGGFKDTASQDGTTLVRVVQGAEETARVPVSAILAGKVANLELLPGDIIVVPRSLY